MCGSIIKVKSVSKYGLKKAFCPCGKCKECRKSIQSQWSLRLSLELETLRKQGWLCGFTTLTYNDEHLPYLPESVFNSNFKRQPCFSRKHVRKLILDIRRELFDSYGVTGLRYMVCAEYGSFTQRPHYHAIFSWFDPNKRLDAKQFYSLLQKFWIYGFLIPRRYDGGFDSKGRYHRPFLIGNSAVSAGVYCAKYCTKDITFLGKISELDIDKYHPDFKDCNVFHLQSQSLGLTYLKSLSPEQVENIWLQGISFEGSKYSHELPLYFKRKLLFNPLYVLERKVYDGTKLLKDDFFTSSDESCEALGYRVEYKRLVRREATSFFWNHRDEIFNKRVYFWRKKLETLEQTDYLMKFGLSPSEAKSISSFIKENSRYLDIPSYLVSRYGVAQKYQYVTDDIDVWLLRYFEPEPDSLKGLDVLPQPLYEHCEAVCGSIFGILRLLVTDYTDDDFRTDFLKDKQKSGGY